MVALGVCLTFYHDRVPIRPVHSSLRRIFKTLSSNQIQHDVSIQNERHPGTRDSLSALCPALCRICSCPFCRFFFKGSRINDLFCAWHHASLLGPSTPIFQGPAPILANNTPMGTARTGPNFSSAPDRKRPIKSGGSSFKDHLHLLQIIQGVIKSDAGLQQ